MMEPKLCHVACRIVLTNTKDFKEKIDDEYRVNMILDNLPMTIPVIGLDKEAPLFYLQGMPVGVKEWLVGVG
jgi:transmembrane 9 superfamily protein 2/4